MLMVNKIFIFNQIFFT